MYLSIHTLNKTDHLKSDRLRNIETLLCSVGFSGIWQSQYCDNYNWLRLALKRKLKDLYIQNWFTLLNSSSSSGCNFRLSKINFERSKYLQLLPNNMSKSLLKFRTRNHKHPIKTGRWARISISERNASSVLMMSVMSITICYAVSISVLKELDSLKPYYFKRANFIKYRDLMNTENKAQRKDLCNFIQIIISKVSQK